MKRGCVRETVRDRFTDDWTECVLGKDALFCVLNSRNRDTDIEKGCVDTEMGLMVGDESGGWDRCMRTAHR